MGKMLYATSDMTTAYDNMHDANATD